MSWFRSEVDLNLGPISNDVKDAGQDLSESEIHVLDENLQGRDRFHVGLDVVHEVEETSFPPSFGGTSF